jgi:hypothetical protein
MIKTTFKDIINNKNLILDFIKNKAGIYQFINTTNNKSYIGSSSILESRFKKHLSKTNNLRQISKGKCLICNAFLKYGYNVFNFKILEFIQLDFNNSLKQKREIIFGKEQFYLEKFKPEYNILLQAGSNLGIKLSLETRSKLSLAKKGKPGNKLGAILSPEVKFLFKEKSGMSVRISMLNYKNELLKTFKSIQDASDITGISRNRISRCCRGIRSKIIEKGIIYKFIYTKI